MKKVFLILLMMVSVVACAQKKKIMEYPTETNENTSGYLYYIESGTTDKNISKATFQANLLDSIAELWDSIVFLNQSLTVTQDEVLNNLEKLSEDLEDIGTWRIEPVGDTMTLSQGDNVYKLYIYDQEAVDKTAPYPKSAEVGNVDATSLIIVPNEALDSDSVSGTGSWEIFVDGVQNTVTNVSLTSSLIDLTLTSSVLPGESIYGVYTPTLPGRIQDVSGNYMKAATFSVKNNTACATKTATNHYLFEYSNSDEIGNDNLVNNAGYVNDNNVIHGSYSANLNSGNYRFELLDIDIADTSTITGANRIYIGSTITRTFASTMVSNDGFTIQYDPSADRLEVVTGSGGSLTEAYSNTLNYPSNTVLRWGVVFWPDDSCTIYVNGIDETDVNTTDDGFDKTQVDLFIGIKPDLTGECYCYGDDVQRYDYALTADEFASKALGYAVETGDCQDDPLTDSDFDIIKLMQFDDIPSGLIGVMNMTQANYQTIEPGSWIESERESPPVVEDALFEIYEGDTALTCIYRQGQCCTETNGDGTHEGGAVDWKIPLPGEYEYLEVSYQIKFEEGFDCGDGGKLIRMRSDEDHGHINYKDAPPDDCEDCDGMSFGNMFQNENAGGVPIIHYDYIHQNGYRDALYGWGYGEGEFYTLTDGEWHEISMRVHLGTANTKTGFKDTFVDGALVSQQTGIMWREFSVISIDILELSFFPGGSSSSYNFPWDGRLWVDNVCVWRYTDAAAGTGNIPDHDEPSPGGRTRDKLPWSTR